MTTLQQEFSTLVSRRDLLIAWVGRTIRARYKQSLLGGLWAVLQSGAATIVLSVVFTRFISIDTDGIPYPIFMYTAMVPWTLFGAGLSDMVFSLVANMNLVKKIYFPREILPLSALIARLFDASIAAVVVIIFLLIYQDALTINLLLWPLIVPVLLIQLMLMIGLGLFGAALNVFYRDVHHIYALVIQLMFYATPIIYPAARVTESTSLPNWFKQLYFLNPMAGIIEAYRSILLQGTAPNGTIWVSLGVSIVCLFVGFAFFKQVDSRFADVV